VSDLAGLDIARARRKRLESQRDPRVRYASTLADRLCELGRFGQKAGAGWYRYVEGKREIDPEVTALIEARSAEFNAEARILDRPRLERRIRASIVNEGARILAEGIAQRALDIDVVMIHGYGYPAWRGGPMFEADEIGTAEILSDMREVHAAFGFGWEPAPLLVELGEAGRRFGDLPPMRKRSAGEPSVPVRP
jgi:3-hydroxyacyl-CoA dehydrogenase